MIELEYTFEDRGDVGQGLVRHPTLWRPGFVANSGVKFNNRELEAAILDVKGYVALGGGLANFDPAQGGTNVLADGKVDIDKKAAVDVTHDFVDIADEATFFAGRPFEARDLNLLMSGVEYGGNYANMKDTGFADPKEYPGPEDAMEFYAALKKNHDRTNAKIKVDVYKENGVFQLRIYLDGELTYKQSIASWQASPLWIQSHWGSGVKFSSMDITERP